MDAVSYALSWLLLGRIRTDLSPAPYDGPRRRPAHELAESVRFVWSRPFFRVLTVWSALANLAVNALFFVAIGLAHGLLEVVRRWRRHHA